MRASCMDRLESSAAMAPKCLLNSSSLRTARSSFLSPCAATAVSKANSRKRERRTAKVKLDRVLLLKHLQLRLRGLRLAERGLLRVCGLLGVASFAATSLAALAAAALLALALPEVALTTDRHGEGRGPHLGSILLLFLHLFLFLLLLLLFHFLQLLFLAAARQGRLARSRGHMDLLYRGAAQHSMAAALWCIVKTSEAASTGTNLQRTHGALHRGN